MRFLLPVMCGLLLSACAGTAEPDVLFRRHSVSFRLAPRPGIHSLDLFIFDGESGELESHSHSDSLSVRAVVRKGAEVRWLLVANAPEGMHPGQLSTVDDNAPDSFVMSGSGCGSFARSHNMQVNVSRLMSKVVLERVVPSEGFRRAYLENVPRTCGYDLIPDRDAVLFSGTDAGLSPFLCRCLVSTEPDGAEFFCYPDPLGRTSIVVEYDSPCGVDVYRAVLPPMQCNTSYIINELMVDSRRELIMSISVKPWEEVDSSCTLE